MIFSKPRWRTTLRVWRVGFVGAWLGVCCAVQCAVTISPVVVQVPADGRAIITVRNDRLHDVMYQLTVLRWQQIDGVDRYEATQDFITSPPLFTLAPSVSQTIRMGLRRPGVWPLEQAYRLMVTEVPKPREAGAPAGRVDLALQYALPVFVAPSLSELAQPLVWQWREDADAVVVRVDNPAARHRVVNAVGLTHAKAQAGQALHTPHVLQRRTTVLAHAWHEWRFPGAVQAGGPPWQIWFVQEGDAAVVRVPEGDALHHVR